MASFSSSSRKGWLQTKAIQPVVVSSLKPDLQCSFSVKDDVQEK